ncbi:LADA_0D08262g1_1 [Lachancea dasiensis]|uniref:LADA_0D08262g1_1 n=1 Tax=Lachancea dasiensis TaxID=1072105 RepID=A0A1G4J732_9SACH|nr:LADA_0D08262g1_1 [Lachancea dasiensis]
MATKRGVNNAKRSKKVNDRSKTAKNQFQGKSLLERMGISQKPMKSNKDSVNSKNMGLRVVDGRLVDANDVGALLRDAAARTESRNGSTKQSHKRGNNGQMVRAQSTKGRLTTTKNGRRVEKTVQRREVARSRDQAAVKPYGKDLYLSLSTSPETRFLRLRNLPLGSDSNSLARTVEQIAGVAVQKTSIIDLPSGSVTAEIWLQSSDSSILAKTQKRLHHANVDNRVISAEIAS